jgi:hypothetical protein
VRGLRATLPPRKAKVDLLITAARYDPQSGKVAMVKGHEPKGVVWTDVLLLPREELLRRRRNGDRVAFGRHIDLASDFELEGMIRLEKSDGREVMLAEGKSGDTDELSVPRF